MGNILEGGGTKIQEQQQHVWRRNTSQHTVQKTFFVFVGDAPLDDTKIRQHHRTFLILFDLKMGLHFSRIWERMFGKKEMRILMVGLDAAGKVWSSVPLENRNVLTFRPSTPNVTDHYLVQAEVRRSCDDNPNHW